MIIDTSMLGQFDALWLSYSDAVRSGALYDGVYFGSTVLIDFTNPSARIRLCNANVAASHRSRHCCGCGQLLLW